MASGSIGSVATIGSNASSYGNPASVSGSTCTAPTSGTVGGVPAGCEATTDGSRADGGDAAAATGDASRGGRAGGGSTGGGASVAQRRHLASSPARDQERHGEAQGIITELPLRERRGDPLIGHRLRSGQGG